MPPAIETARWIVAGLFAILLVIASVSDIRYRLIPNWSVLALLALFIPWIFVGPDVSVVLSLARFATFFAAGVALYAFGIWGAGDSKLMAAVALFISWDQLQLFLFATALCGGILALAIIVIRRWWAIERTVPYGVAIAAGAVLAVFNGMG